MLPLTYRFQDDLSTETRYTEYGILAASAYIRNVLREIVSLCRSHPRTDTLQPGVRDSGFVQPPIHDSNLP